ncbi:MAG TPA: PQQ-binding-like beta-propeller repeat protein, partial [Thermomicrobiales bacterium]|nr:PQQ-binding-like beta-propeller repeat protein [Thermomicrobiales bacterium]
QNPADWAVPAGTLAGTRANLHSAIDSSNVNQLQLAWTFPVTAPGSFGGMTASTLIVGDTVYVQDMQSNVFALDRATGDVRWEKKYNTPSEGPNGVAVGYGMVFGSTGDGGEAFALDAKDGHEIWRIKLTTNPSTGIDMAPIVFNNVVYVSTVPGTSSIFYQGGQRGIVYALDARTGAALWSFDTTTDNLWGNPALNSGGGAWYPVSLDDQGNLYIGTGNAGPWPGIVVNGTPYPNGSSRPGPNDYASSMLSLNPNGGLRWNVNAAPHDLFDHDLQLTPIVATVTIDGKPTKVAIGSGKAGKVIAADADTGKVLWETPVGKHQNDDLTAIPEGQTVVVYPGGLGSVESPMAYADGLVFVPVFDAGQKFTSTTQGDFVDPFNEAKGGLIALDAATGKVVWQVDYPKMNVCGVTVANDVVFSMALDGVLHAYDAKTGKELWNYQANGGCNGSPAVAGDLLVVPAAGPNFAASGTPTAGVASAVLAFRLPAAPGATPAAQAAASPAATASAPPTLAAPAPTTAPAPAATPAPAAAASPLAQGAAGPTIQLIDIAFNPNTFTIPANTPTTVTLTDAGVSVHNFNIDQLNVHSGDLQPGQSAQVTIDAPAGTYQYYCNIPGHKEAGMVGTLTVK